MKVANCVGDLTNLTNYNELVSMLVLSNIIIS